MVLAAAIGGWQSPHWTITGFPIDLLLFVPLFILAAAVLSPHHGRPFMLAALILLTLGTAGLFFPGSSAGAPAKLLPGNGTGDGLLGMHQNPALETRGIFVMLLVLYISVMLVPRVLHREGRLFSTVLPLAFLVLYCAGAVVLVNTAHLGPGVAHGSEGVSSSSSPAGPASHSGN